MHQRMFICENTAEVVEPGMLEEVGVERKATVIRVPTRILGSEVKKLRKREVKLMKVQWEEDPENATWETEDKIRASYPFLFKGMFLTSFSKAFIGTCFYRLSTSYQSSTFRQETHGCKHVFETCYV